MKEFNPTRLRDARRSSGMTQVALAQAVGLSARAIAGFERGENTPSPVNMGRISEVLDFPEGFFAGDDLQWPDEMTVSFRAMSKMKAYQRDMALGEGALALLLNDWIDERFELPEAVLPDLSHHDWPETAATALRHSWGQGEQPIPNVIHLLESKGVRVFSLSVQSREVDAFSAWSGDTPFMFLNTQKSAERSRFDAAHELGHLVLHRHVKNRRSDARDDEQEADQFASAFLMPRQGLTAQAPRHPVLPVLMKLKLTWKVSLAALVHRLHGIGKINDWQYRNLMAEIGRLGYRTKEPNSVPRETSQALTKVFAVLRKEGMSKADVAKQVNLYEDKLNQLIFGLTITSMRGGKIAQSPGTRPSSTQLELVK